MANSVTLQDPNTNFFRPQSGVQDNTLAGAFKAGGELLKAGVQIHDTGEKNDLRSSLNNFSDNLDAEAEGLQQELRRIDASELNSLQKRINKLQAAASSGARESSVKIKAEAVLKEFTARTPRLTNEFRNVASGVLGFDPTGAEIKSRFNEAKQAKIQLATLEKRYLSLGLESRLFGTKEGTENQIAIERNLSIAANANAAISAAESVGKLEAINAPIRLKEVGVGAFLNVRARASSLIKDAFGKELGEISDKDISNIDATDLRTLVADLEGIGLETKQAIRLQFAGLPGIDDKAINEAVQGTTDFLKLLSNRIDLSVTAEQVKNSNNLTNSLVKADLLDNPIIQKFMVFNELFNNLKLPPDASVELLTTVGNAINGIVNPMGNANPKEVATTYKEMFKAANIKDATKEQEDAFIDLTDKIVEGGLRNFTDMTIEQRDGLLSVFSDENFVEVLNKSDLDGDLKEKVTQIADNYAFKIMENAFNNAEDVLSGNVKASSSDTISDFVNVTVGKQGFVVRPNAFKNDSDKKQARNIADGLNAKWIKRLNRAMQVVANVQDGTVEEVINNSAVFTTNPFLVDFIGKALDNADKAEAK